jgi:hypothetical protein
LGRLLRAAGYFRLARKNKLPARRRLDYAYLLIVPQQQLRDMVVVLLVMICLFV